MAHMWDDGENRYRTSDGQVFNTGYDAERHQAELDRQAGSSGGGGPGAGDRLLSGYKQAFASFRSNDFDTAIKLCNAVLDNAKGWVGKNDPYYAKFVASTYDLRGCCYAEKAKINKNITYFDQAIADSETAVEWVNNIDWSKNSDVKTNVEAPKNLAENLVSKGFAYYQGNGVPKDYAKAIELFRKAADMGSASAMNNLGKLYANGEGVPKDMAKAIELYRKAADLGNTESMVSLGFAYYQGNGVPKDYAKAIEPWQKAADMGSADAFSNLGTCYATGNGVKQDYAKAIEWYKKAVANGNEDAKKYLALAEKKLAEQSK